MVLAKKRLSSLSDLRGPGALDKETYIRKLYRVILGREPDPSGFNRLLARDDVENFFGSMLASREFRNLARLPAYAVAGSFKQAPRRRVLLFGAYGNGNVGDAIQASSLARAINSIRPDIEVWSSSALPAPYPFPYHRTLAAADLLRSSLINSFDLLLIGGGGLLAHPHDPLTNPDWQRMLEVPIALFGIGAETITAGKSETLVRKSAYVSGRDPQSLNSLAAYTDNFHFVSDPVLCDSSYRSDISPPPVIEFPKRLWILKYSNSDDFKELCEAIVRREDAVCFLEPHLDWRIVQYIPDAIPIYCVNDVLALIDQVDAVYSMRYHGCILAMLRGKAAYGLQEPKCLSLLSRYNNADNFSSCLRYPDTTPQWNVLSEKKLAEDRENFFSALRQVLDLVPQD